MTTTFTVNEEGTTGALPLHLQVFASPTRTIGGGGNRTFSPITSTLIYGPNDAVLVDAQFIKDDVDALGDTIEKLGRRLTTIFITHGHADHYFGAGSLVTRFPGAQMVATKSVAGYIASHIERDTSTWSSMFPDDMVTPSLQPVPLAGDVIPLEDHELHVIEAGQGDIAPCAVLHIPTLAAVVAGDVAYNQIHQMLGFGGPKEWERWIESIGMIERLQPQMVIAGHKKLGALDTGARKILADTRSYIQDFSHAVAAGQSLGQIVETMQTKYPEHDNMTTLLYSANAAVSARLSSSRAS